MMEALPAVVVFAMEGALLVLQKVALRALQLLPRLLSFVEVDPLALEQWFVCSYCLCLSLFGVFGKRCDI